MKILPTTNKSIHFSRRLIGILVVLVCIGSICSILAQSASADDSTSFSIANYFPIANKNVKDGDIVSYSGGGYTLSKKPYDSLIVGVVTAHPAISLQINGENNTYPVVSAGDTPVNVTTANGKIKKGDSITSSTTPGVGMKATQSGYIIGAALDDDTADNPKEIRQIRISQKIQYYVIQSPIKTNLFDILSLSTVATYEEPVRAFRYLTAAVVIILAFVMGFFIFSRTANKGLEALGRNPLASRTIQIGILLNVTIAISIILAGLAIAFLVIRL